MNLPFIASLVAFIRQHLLALAAVLLEISPSTRTSAVCRLALAAALPRLSGQTTASNATR